MENLEEASRAAVLVNRYLRRPLALRVDQPLAEVSIETLRVETLYQRGWVFCLRVRQNGFPVLDGYCLDVYEVRPRYLYAKYLGELQNYTGIGDEWDFVTHLPPGRGRVIFNLRRVNEEPAQTLPQNF